MRNASERLQWWVVIRKRATEKFFLRPGKLSQVQVTEPWLGGHTKFHFQAANRGQPALEIPAGLPCLNSQWKDGKAEYGITREEEKVRMANSISEEGWPDKGSRAGRAM